MNRQAKVIVQLIVVFGMCFLMLGSAGQGAVAENGFAGGSGTEADPYLVETPDQLNNVRNHLDKHFKQIADIDLDVAPYNTDTGWEPIGNTVNYMDPIQSESFSGVYDGNGHKIMNVQVNRAEDSGSGGFGLFGFVWNDGEVENVALEGVNVTADNWYTGSLVGYNKGAVIHSYAQCNPSDMISGSDHHAGGLVGYNEGTITESYSECDVEGGFDYGGLVGSNFGTISDCYATGNVTPGDGLRGGGLVGSNWASVSNCYVTGTIGNPATWSVDIGPLVGANSGTLTSSYWNVNAYGLTEPQGDDGKTTTQMQQKATYNGWDFDTIWGIEEGVGYPYHQDLVADPIAPEITSADSTTFTAGEAGTFTVTATGEPLPALTQTGALPGEVIFTDNGDGIASLVGTPAAGSGGVYTMTITASNGVDPDAVQAFTLTVRTVKPIGGGGGTIDSNGGALTVAVPVGSVEDGTEFTLVPQSQPGHATGDLSFAGTSFQLTAEDALGDPVTDFDPPLIVTIQYDPADLGDIAESSLKLYTWDTNTQTWTDDACGPYDRSVPGQFTVAICHLSEFAVLGELFDEDVGFPIFLPLIQQ